MRFLAFAAAFLAAALFAAPGLAEEEKQSPPYPLYGAVDNFAANTIDSKRFDLKKDAAGKAVLIYVWAPEFAPCLDALKKLDDFMAGYERKGELVAVTIIRGTEEKEVKAAREAMEKIGGSLTILTDPKLELIRRLGAFQIPAFQLIDKNGRLATQPVPVFDELIYSMKFTDFIPLVLDGKKIASHEFVLDPPRRLIGKTAPPFALPDLKGSLQSPEYYQGKNNLILVLWSPTCPHCKRELPRMQKFYEANKKKENFELIAVFGVRDDSYVEMAQTFVKENSITFPVVADMKLDVFDNYLNRAVPYVFLIDRSGKIVETVSGEHDDLAAIYNPILKDMNEN